MEWTIYQVVIVYSYSLHVGIDYYWTDKREPPFLQILADGR